MIRTGIAILKVECYGCAGGKFCINNPDKHVCDTCGGVGQKVSYECERLLTAAEMR